MKEIHAKDLFQLKHIELEENKSGYENSF